MSNDDLFDDAPPAAGSKYPAFSQLARGGKAATRVYAPGSDQEQSVKNVKGRLVIMKLTKMERQVPNTNPDGKITKVDKARGDIHVLSGEPIKGKADIRGDMVQEWDEALVPPFVLPNTFINGTMLIGQFDSRAKRLDVTCDQPGDKEIIISGVLGTLPPQGTKSGSYVLFASNDDEKKVLAEYWKGYKAAQPDPFA